MSLDATDLATLLPQPMPASPNRQLLLFGIRRLAAYGLNDAHAAHALLIGFGRGFRRPLVLLRALMAELSFASTQRLTVAPCCCPRLTQAEASLIDVIVDARADPRAAHAILVGLMRVPHALGALSSAQAVGQAFADLGRPL